ncbi:MAG: hypothetical protein FJY77_01725 [Candidatus Altiarchaeales archaeon]|nr:hypothetical protein [Candidatus Altiarchaeales archaeon]
MFQKTIVGNYPRPSWLRESLLKAEGKQKKAGLAGKEVESLYVRGIAEVIAEFESCNLDLITDGQLRLTDALASFCENLEGFKMTGLIRYYDNNFYYRQPETTGKISWKNPVFEADFKQAKKLAKKKIKCVLPGPYTLARLCKNTFYKDTSDLMWDLSSAIASEAKALENAGCKFIQFDEPSLVYDRKLECGLDKIMDALKKVESSVSAITCLQAYFGGFNGSLAGLLDLKFDVIGFDLVEGKENLNFMQEYTPKKDLSLGILDSRNIRLEKPSVVKARVMQAVKLTSPKNVYINPNWGLELIPREYAVKKLKLLSNIVDELKEDSA